MAAADRNEKLMEEDHGTKCLATDQKADYYMNLYAREKAKEEMVWRLAFDTQDD
jgi:hypothetical protein